MMQNSWKKEKMATRVLPKPLHFENYDFFFNNPLSSASAFNFHQLNKIVEMHGFFKLNHGNRRKEMVLEALSGIDEFMNPHRSTLNEKTLSFNNNGCLTIDEVNDDLDALQWHEFFVHHFQSLSYNDNDNNNDNDNDNNGSGHLEELKPRKRVRKVKEKKVFDPVYLTRPRSMKSQKRRNINEIGLSACLV